jgi:ABC-type multidrug transport system ATPase subunit
MPFSVEMDRENSPFAKWLQELQKPDSGWALLDGEDITGNVRQVWRKIGIVLGPTLFYYRMKGYAYLGVLCKNIRRTESGETMQTFAGRGPRQFLSR